MNRYLFYFVKTFVIFSFLGCSKYKDLPSIPSPTYLRIFNDISELQDPTKIGQAVPFFTVLYDPTFDASGIPNGAAIVGDFLQARQTFSLSYPINADNAGKSDKSSYTQNFDIPGNQHLLTAPSINGLDLSAWGQFPSGKHRILFIQRPFNDTPFAKLPILAKQQILIDATVDLAAGEVYTMEAVTYDLDHSKYGIYLRKEPFARQRFSPDSLYANFFKLSGIKPKVYNTTSPYNDYYEDSLVFSYTYFLYDDNVSNFRVIPGMNQQYFTTLYGNFQTAAQYLELPLLPSRIFFDSQGTIRTYGSQSIYGAVTHGTFPYLMFNFSRQGQLGPDGLPIVYAINCDADPSTINQLVPQSAVALKNVFSVPNLNLISQRGNTYNVYSSINTFELVNDKVYLMQVQRYF